MPLSRNLGTLTFWNLLGHYRPVTGLTIVLLNRITETILATQGRKYVMLDIPVTFWNPLGHYRPVMGLTIVLLNRITETILATQGRKYLMLASPDLSIGDWNAWSYSLTCQYLYLSWKYLLFTCVFWKKSPLRRLRRGMGVCC